MGLGTYDAINIYKNGVEEAGTADYNNDLDGIVEALEQTDHTGVSGQIQFFAPDHEYPHDVKVSDDLLPFTQVQWQEDGDGGGVRECVFPEQFATAEHVLPPWLS
jgi:branched-chain amino acid transport system substrate-binding protein